jgi:hypothetical protein
VQDYNIVNNGGGDASVPTGSSAPNADALTSSVGASVPNTGVTQTPSVPAVGAGTAVNTTTAAVSSATTTVASYVSHVMKLDATSIGMMHKIVDKLVLHQVCG